MYLTPESSSPVHMQLVNHTRQQQFDNVRRALFQTPELLTPDASYTPPSTPPIASVTTPPTVATLPELRYNPSVTRNSPVARLLTYSPDNARSPFNSPGVVHTPNSSQGYIEFYRTNISSSPLSRLEMVELQLIDDEDEE